MTYDFTRPTVVLSTTAADPTNAAFQVTATFSEDVTGLDETEIVVTNGEASNLMGSGTTYTATITPTADGAVTVDIAAAKANDQAGNTNTASNTISIICDATAPTVTSITRVDADQLNNNDTDADFRVVFSEEVNQVDAIDFETVVTGTATGTVNTVTKVDAKTYTVNVNAISGQGTVQLNSKEDVVITDNAGNLLTEEARGEAYTINWIPTEISLTNGSVAENLPSGTVVGDLQTVDQDTDDSHTYELVSGSGSTDNGSFTIDGTTLKAAEVFDFEAKTSYSIRVKTADGKGGLLEQVLEIAIDNELEASVIIEADGAFAETILGFSDVQTWELVNDGEVAVEVRIASATPGFSILPGSLVIAAGDTREIEAVFTPQEAREYEGTINLSYAEQTITVAVSGQGLLVTDIEDPILDEELLSVYPNPASDQLRIDLSAFKGQKIDVSISTTDGKRMLMLPSFNDTAISLDVSGYEGGLYIIRVNNKVSAINKKFIIKR
jgi:hypothetical protein